MVFGLRNTPKRSRIRGLKRLGRWMNRAPKDIAAAAGAAGGTDFTVATVTNNYTMLDTDGLVVLGAATAATRTITLHATPVEQVLYFRNATPAVAGVNMVLDPAGGILIDGTTTVSIVGGIGLVVAWDGTGYWSVS